MKFNELKIGDRIYVLTANGQKVEARITNDKPYANSDNIIVILAGSHCEVLIEKTTVVSKIVTVCNDKEIPISKPFVFEFMATHAEMVKNPIHWYSTSCMKGYSEWRMGDFNYFADNLCLPWNYQFGEAVGKKFKVTVEEIS